MYILITIGIFFIALAFFQWRWSIFSIYFHPWLNQNATLLGAYRSLIAFIGFPVIILGGLYTYLQIIERLERPAVAIELVHPKNTAVSVKNISKTVVRDPKYHVALFNISAPPETRGNLLPIPVHTGDYIRVGSHWGPNSMLSLPAISKLIENGDHLLGWATVTCPTCSTRYYWVYIEDGQGGWFAELENDIFPDWAGIQKLTENPDNAVAVFHKLSPEEKRQVIK